MANGLVRNYVDCLEYLYDVLILVVVDNGLVHENQFSEINKWVVLILVVMDNGLVHIIQEAVTAGQE